MNTYHEQFPVGTRIKLANSGPCGKYDGTTSDFGVVLAHTDDEGASTFRVRFDDGKIEEHLMFDEIENPALTPDQKILREYAPIFFPGYKK